MDRVFGELAGWKEGQKFADRIALAQSGIHKPTQAGISYSEKEGADSIVLSGGYADDEDFGDEIVYTGMGGRDPNSGKQVKDQPFDRGNKALALNVLEGLPVRVVRGYTHDSQYSPVTGYSYGGVYAVEDYWHEAGKHGFLVWRFRLEKQVQTKQPPISPNTSSAGATAPANRQEVTIQRIVRDTQKARNVKQCHSYHCQVCGIAVATPAGLYAEAAHIQPLGKPHNGPDIESNILCLCPNHHVMFDNGSFSIADDFSLVGLGGKLRTAPSHNVDVCYLAYHRTHYGMG